MPEDHDEVPAPPGDATRYRGRDELAMHYSRLSAAPRDRGRVLLIVARVGAGARETPEHTRLTPEAGVPGDAWARHAKPNPDAQLTVMNGAVAVLIANGQPLSVFGDNLFVDLDLSAANLPAGTRLRVGDALIEMTPKPHNGCHKFKARFGLDALLFVQAKETRHRNLRGVYWKVVEVGDVWLGAPIQVLERGPTS